jgi:hypothetical protein
MYEWMAWDLHKQRTEHANRLAERARLEREARQSKRPTHTKG